jgi:hypothetical protein
MTKLIGTITVGDDASFLVRCLNSSGVAEDITGHTVAVTIYSPSVAGEIVLTIGAGLTLLAQSGVTLGHIQAKIPDDGYPSAWLSAAKEFKAYIKIRTVDASGNVTTREEQQAKTPDYRELWFRPLRNRS